MSILKMSCCTNAFAARLLALLLTGIAQLTVLHAQSNYATPYTFTTLAGDALSGIADGTGSAAGFDNPRGVATDGSGNVYVADTLSYTIRKVTPGGLVTTLAGEAGESGSTDGTGSAARFAFPVAVAADGTGNVYVTDNHTIRKITPAGVVTTLAGMPGISGSADGAGSAARFSFLSGVAVDGSGTLYVADTDNCTVRKITSSGIVTTYAGTVPNSGFGSNGSPGFVDGTGSLARFTFPGGVAVDASGNVFVADTQNHSVRKIAPGGIVTTLAGIGGFMGEGSSDGPGSTARFSYPNSVAVDGAGNVYVADVGNFTIRKIMPDGVVTTFAGTAGSRGLVDSTGSNARFYSPNGVAVGGSDTVYVADSVNSAIRKITPAAQVTTLAGGGSGGRGTADGVGSAARFNQPTDVAADGYGNLYVADSNNATIRKITSAGEVTTLAGSAGNIGSVDGTGSAALFHTPKGLAVDGSGNVFVADFDNSTIRKITAAGIVTTFAGAANIAGTIDATGSAARFDHPSHVAVDSAGNVYVADTNNHTIRKITSAGAVTTFAGKAGYAGSVDGTGSAARFSFPSGVAVNAAGIVYVTDDVTVRKITSSGVVTTIAGVFQIQGTADGTGSAALFSFPDGVAVDQSGNIYVADVYSDTIRKITSAGVVTTLGGRANSDGSTDGTGSAARFSWPSGVAVDVSGNLYIADYFNHTIRKGVPATIVAPSDAIITITVE